MVTSTQLTAQKWNAVECYSMTSKVAKQNWTSGLDKAVNSSNMIKGAGAYLAALVVKAVKGVFVGLVAVFESLKAVVYSLPRNLIVHIHNKPLEGRIAVALEAEAKAQAEAEAKAQAEKALLDNNNEDAQIAIDAKAQAEAQVKSAHRHRVIAISAAVVLAVGAVLVGQYSGVNDTVFSAAGRSIASVWDAYSRYSLGTCPNPYLGASANDTQCIGVGFPS